MTPSHDGDALLPSLRLEKDGYLDFFGPAVSSGQGSLTSKGQGDF